MLSSGQLSNLSVDGDVLDTQYYLVTNPHDDILDLDPDIFSTRASVSAVWVDRRTADASVIFNTD